MSFTTKTFRFALAAAALCAVHGAAEAKPRHIVILDFDGPRELADAGNAAVKDALADYDLVAKKRWETARVNAQRTGAGPQTWAKAAKAAGVDAVIEGWVQEEGRHKMLTVVVRDAQTGNQYDQLSVKVSPQGLSVNQAQALHDGLEERLQWIEASFEGNPNPLDTVRLGGTAKPPVGAKKDKVAPPPPAAEDEDDDSATVAARPKKKKAKPQQEVQTTEDDGQTTEVTAPTKPAPTEVAALGNGKQECYDLFGACPVDPAEVVGIKKKHEPKPTHRFRIGGGGFLSSRSLLFDAEKIENITQYPGVAGKGFSLSGEAYPFPLKKMDGQLSGIGFSFSVYKSVGSIVGIDTDNTTGDYTTNQNGFMVGVHWRQPLGDVIAIDSELGYSQDNYIIEDPPEGYEVPDTEYKAVHAGVHVDLNIAERATVGFGGRYFYMLGDGGMLNSVDFYGPGDLSGWSLDANFIVPLPKDLYVRGSLEYKRVTTEFQGVGQITEDDNVFYATDSNIALNVNLGIQF
jgi:hypothetical protein